MKIVMFYHSLMSDWNHGNAHFLRGVCTELIHRGHDLHVYEPEGNWSLQNLLNDYGSEPVEEFKSLFPRLRSKSYCPSSINLNDVLHGADMVIVHEWNDHDLVRMIGEHRKDNSYVLLFHDTHHRSVTEKDSMASYDLRYYDGVLAFGEVIRSLYISNGWCRNAYTWHEAADTTVFYPKLEYPEGDLVWVGNWGDEERTAELHEFLINPVKELGLKAKVYGVRYPEHAIRSLAEAGIEYGGWLPNYRSPEVFSRYKMTVHVPRRPYVESLPGIPTIRPFEAMACGIPLISAPWNDAEKLFTPGTDFLVASNGEEMKKHMKLLLTSEEKRNELRQNGLNTINGRHTCIHRVNELLKIYSTLSQTIIKPKNLTAA